nr:C-type lectin domain family 4 member E-like [Biomphalaria glabrata]
MYRCLNFLITEVSLKDQQRLEMSFTTDVFMFLVAAVFLFQDIVGLMSTSYLHRYPRDHADLWSTGPEVSSEDKVQCAMFCQTNQTECQSFSYDKQTGKCQIGRCVIPWPNSTSSSIQLYQVQQPLCESTPGFKMFTFGNISACLWLSSSFKNFTDAKAHCQGMKSTLASVKSVEKLQLLISSRNQDAYIGLDDLVKTGTFVWHDDGTVLGSELMPQIFAYDEPSFGVTPENCVMYTKSQLALNNVVCSRAHYYVCEKQCFQF